MGYSKNTGNRKDNQKAGIDTILKKLYHIKPD